MFEVKILTPEGSAVRAELIGEIDEHANLENRLEASAPELHLQCRQVTRINSIGIKVWRDFFHKLRRTGTRLRFFELSPPLVCQLNYLSDFVEIPEIGSICAPFLCNGCHRTTLRSFTPAELEGISRELPPVPCHSCGQPAAFDDIPEEYFSFLD